jgi:thiol-disulfide isomerase/thioredoxin
MSTKLNMKNIIKHSLLIALVIFSSISKGQSKIDFIDDDYTKALEKSKELNKQLMVMFYADWCPHCTVMKTTVLNDESVIQTLNSNYVNVQINVDKPESKPLMKQFGIVTFPAFLFIDSTETMLYSAVGEINKTDFLVEARKSLNPRLQLPFLKAQFESDTLNGVKCLNYLNGLRRGIQKNKTAEIASNYISSVKEEQIVSLLNWRILAYAVNDLTSKDLPNMLKYRNEFAKLITSTRVETKINNVVSLSFKNDVTKLDSANYSKNKNFVRNEMKMNVDSLAFKYDIQLYENLKDWPKYNAVAKKMLSKMLWDDAAKINDIVKNYVRHISSTSDLKIASGWMNRSLELNNNYEANFIQSKLYLKLKNFPEAIKYARVAKKYVVEMKIDTKEIDKLYTQLAIK